MNSTLNIKLRGSGLNVELPGELVRLGPTQKEAGICFKSPSASAQRELAEWIGRQARQNEAPPPDESSRLTPMLATPAAFSPAGEKSSSHSFSAAIARSQAESRVEPAPIPVESGSDATRAPASPAMAIPLHDCAVPANDSGDRAQILSADSPGSPESLHDEPTVRDLPPPDLSPAERGMETSTENPSPVVAAGESVTPAPDELPHADAETAGAPELPTTEEIQPIPPASVFAPPQSLPSAAAERWIPPAILAAWRTGNRQRKCLLAAAGTICLAFFALTMTFAVAHLQSSLGRVERNDPPQLTAPSVPVALPAASAVVSQPGPAQAPPPPAAAPPKSHRRPPDSLLASLSKAFIGNDSDESKPQIDDDQMHVRVWTSKSSGYYYCTDDPYYKNAQPGAFMSQGDALQSGYRSILGQFCN